MKFLLRSLIVLAVAVAFGATLYLAVQALPNDTPKPPPNSNVQPERNTQPVNPAPRPGRAENNRGISWRFLLGLARRIVVFSVIIFAAILGKNYLFERKPNKKKTGD